MASLPSGVPATVTRAIPIASVLALAIGGLLLVASTFGPWTNYGLGSSMSGHALGDLLLNGTFALWAPRWAGFALYVVPLAGAVIVLGGGLGTWVGRVMVVGATVSACCAWLFVSRTLNWRPVTDPGWGSVVAAVGLASASGGIVGSVVVGGGRLNRATLDRVNDS